MTVLVAALARWARLAVAIGLGLASLLAATQARRWLAVDRDWTSFERQRLLGDGAVALAVVAVVAATLAAVETALRLRRDGVLATLCVSAASMGRLAAIAATAAAFTGAAVLAAAAIAQEVVAPPAALARVATGWLWQPWPSVPPLTLAVAMADAQPAVAFATDGASGRPLLAGLAGAAAVAAAFAFGALANARLRLAPHLLALDVLAVAAALWLATPGAAVAFVAFTALACWRAVARRGPRRSA